ncbi:hypothetical protein AYJ54_34020 [Bradyrhizobium centrolobii]|uniref:EGF-like domain-containing protein n=1 Tax=Bradyrhizobium centrolobii TaxID=1505087 RepID=A0A176Y8E5_9BRAD|nr:hypothetical protein [Bradyrhizobium centrolobii]OAE98571.1 hypothetical protein AYJ54_34020 [Bradyrhizobium centrolobii]
MTRFAAAICLGLGLGLCALAPWPGQTQDSATADRCFPWQEFHNGVCVAKPAPLAPPPLPAAPAPSPPLNSSIGPTERGDSANPPACPANSHFDPAGGGCVADAPARPVTPRTLTTITCNGGMASNGQCVCPAGFDLMPAGSDPGGTCVRTHAENCLGGAMTVSGQCLCTGQVTMSGQVYDLEFSKGKCVPKRCPREGPCATAAAKPGNDALPKLSSDDPEQHRACGRGMVAKRRGCVPARPRSQTIDPGVYFRIRPSYPSPMPY